MAIEEIKIPGAVLVLPAKGQLISKANSTVFTWTKKRTKIFFYFCPEDILLRGFKPHSRKYVFFLIYDVLHITLVSLIVWSVHNLFYLNSKGILKGQIEEKKIFPWVGLEPTNLESIFGQKYKNISFVFWFKWKL